MQVGIEYRATGLLADESNSRRARRVQPKLALDEMEEEMPDLRDNQQDHVELGMRLLAMGGDL